MSMRVTPLFSPIAIDTTSNPPQIRIFAGGGDNPDLGGGVGPYHVFGFEDADKAGQCNPAKTLFASPLPANNKVWSAPTVSGDQVLVATATGKVLDPCSVDPNDPGSLFGYKAAGNGLGQPVQIWNPISLAGGGGAVGGIRAYDGHVIINTLKAGTTIVGAPTWNNPVAGKGGGGGGGGLQTTLSTSAWYQR